MTHARRGLGLTSRPRSHKEGGSRCAIGAADDPVLCFGAATQILFDHQEQQKFIDEHLWRPGDILMWDNRCTLHARTDFSPTERRLLRRVTILGETPV